MAMCKHEKEAGRMRCVCGALMCLVPLALVSACFSLTPPYQRFIKWADSKVALNQTIEQLGFNPQYPLGSYLANERYLSFTEVGADGRLIYHYARPTLEKDKVCHYHLIVEPESRLVVGWGFDREFGDPKKACGVAG